MPGAHLAGVWVDVRVGAVVVVEIVVGMGPVIWGHVSTVGAIVPPHVIVSPGLLTTQHCTCKHSREQKLLDHWISPVEKWELHLCNRPPR
jgi:hypothetical protein